MTKRLSIIPSAAVSDRRLCRTDLAVLCALGTYTDRHGKCWPATTSLAGDIHVSTSIIRRARRALERCGYLETTHHPGRRSTYQIVGFTDVDPGQIGSGVDTDPGQIGSGGAEPQVPGTPVAGVPPNEILNEKLNDTDGAFPALKDFDAFWQSYPSRRQHGNPKKPAMAKFEAAVKSGTPPADIICGAENYAAYVQQEHTEPRFVAQAQTWLSQERWTEYQTVIPPSETAYGNDVIH